MRKLSASVALGVFMTLSVQAVRAEDACTIVPIDMLGGKGAHVSGLNNWGQAIGTIFYEAARDTAYVWRDGRTRALPRLDPRGSTYAAAINDFGTIVGTAESNGVVVPVWWSLRGVRRLPGNDEDVPRDLNNRGQVVGNRGFSECLLWRDAFSEPVVLGGLGGDFCFAHAINDWGEIVGGADVPSGEVHAFVWRDGVFTDLGDYPHEGADLGMELLDINNRGLAVGRVLHSLQTDLLIWTREGGRRVIEFPHADLPELIVDGPASSVNEWGLIVAHDYSEVGHLLLLDRVGHIREVGTLGGHVSYDDVFVNERFQLAWDADLKPYFCELRWSSLF